MAKSADRRTTPGDKVTSRPPVGLESTISYWTTRAIEIAEGREHWEGHPIAQAVQDERRGGLGLVDFVRRHLRNEEIRGLALGVGLAQGEIDLLRTGAVASFDLYDVTPQLLERVRAKLEHESLAARARYHVADINRLELCEGAYDLVTFFNALHHIENLEHVLAQCARALRSGGILVAHEYVGPKRFRFPPEHVDLARSIYRTLDPGLRCPWPELPVPDPSAVADADPTESIRSDEIIAIAKEIFPSLQVISYDVCLTIILWYGLNHNALFETPAGCDLVRWMLEVDHGLVRSGRLSTYQALLLARKVPL